MPATKTVTVRLPPDILEKLAALARQDPNNLRAEPGKVARQMIEVAIARGFSVGEYYDLCSERASSASKETAG